jgi:beta-phosphoglucomutase-like phosphatase (HAD superfamily)
MSEAIAAVFDLDGVLVDSEPVWDAARREVAARSGGHGFVHRQRQATAVCPLLALSDVPDASTNVCFQGMADMARTSAT